MKTVIFAFALFLSVCASAQQDRIEQIRSELETIIVDQPGLEDPIESSVAGVPLTEYLRAIGIQHQLNLSVQDNLNVLVNNNFANVSVLDVMVFLCKQHDLTIDFYGGILSINKYVPPLAPVPEIVKYIPEVSFNEKNGFVSLDLKNDSLPEVVKYLTALGPQNVILGPGLSQKKVSAFIQNRPFVDALEKMCFANDLVLREEGSFVLIEAKEVEKTTSQQTAGRKELKVTTGVLEVSAKDDLLTVFADGADMGEIIEKVAVELGKHYFIYTRPEGEVSIFVENATFDQFLMHLFHSTGFSFIYQNDVYLIGSDEKDNLVTTELIQLQYRTIENVFGSFGRSNNNTGNQNNSGTASGRNSNRNGGGNYNPFEGTGLEIQPFPELNSFIVTGSFTGVHQFKRFIHSIDQIVPVVLIEVLIVDVNKSRALTAGVNAGIGENAGQTQGPITGDGQNAGMNIDLSTESINNLIGSLNGLGVVNLGNVTPQFYLSIQALETDGVLKMRSTPKLATLNSYTASLKIGQQEYYLQTTSIVNPSATATVVSEQQDWIPLNADLSIDITPVVSGEEQVTLEITVIQSNFTERAGANGPFGSVNREFTSIIRVKNGEMILLGGLEDKSVSNSGSGLPFLSRIPVLKWFFGKRSRSKSDTRLNIFIRPTIMY